jgi:DNA (cytosine-5)-methyltransferase 1
MFTTHYDLFAGIGGFALALKGKVDKHIHVEIDKHCQRVLQLAFPNSEIHSDVLVYSPDKIDSRSILTGGFPCQSFSRNGKGYNHNNKTVVSTDSRANLFLEIVRILGIAQPSVFILENVKEIMTIKSPSGEPMIDIIIEALSSAGYKVTTELNCPTEFGVPQQRKRVFFLGIRNDAGFEFLPKNVGTKKSKVLDIMDDEVNDSFKLDYLWRNRKLNKDKSVFRLEALVMAYNSGTWKTSYKAETSSITPVGIIYGDTPSGLPRQQDKLYSVYGISPTLATFSTPAFDHPNGWRVLTPNECLKLQSFPDDHPISRNVATGYKQTGNAVNVEVVKSIIQRIKII